MWGHLARWSTILRSNDADRKSLHPRSSSNTGGSVSGVVLGVLARVACSTASDDEQDAGGLQLRHSTGLARGPLRHTPRQFHLLRFLGRRYRWSFSLTFEHTLNNIHSHTFSDNNNCSTHVLNEHAVANDELGDTAWDTEERKNEPQCTKKHEKMSPQCRKMFGLGDLQTYLTLPYLILSATAKSDCYL